MDSDLTYTEPPASARAAIARGFENIGQGAETLPSVAELAERLRSVPEPTPNVDGETEQLGDVTATHRFVDAPGDSETVRWHLVECGPAEAETVVFLHGVPDSWWQWHHVMEAIGHDRHCLSIDLKGYGQSDKRTGDYRQRGVAEQLLALLDELGVGRFSLVTHDRGTPPSDYLVASAGERVIRYGRGQQHLWHLHPDLHPQEGMFTGSHAHELLSDAPGLVATGYGLLAEKPVDIADLRRVVQEFSFPGIASAVPRYFHSSSFRQEWVDRRRELIEQWQCPVRLFQGKNDPAQPAEFYEDPKVLGRLPAGSDVQFIDAGHFWPFEAVGETVDAIRNFV